MTTKVAPLMDYKNKSLDKRLARLKDSVFAKTWILYTGMPTSDETFGSAKNADLWTGKLPIGEWDELALVRNVGLNSVGVLNSTSIKLAASLEIPHHEGAGGEDNFVSKKEYKKHVKKNEKWASKRSQRKKNRL